MRDFWSPSTTLNSRSITRGAIIALLGISLAGCGTTTPTTTSDDLAGPASTEPSLGNALDDAYARLNAQRGDRGATGRTEVPQGDGGLGPDEPRFNDPDTIARPRTTAPGAATSTPATTASAARGSFTDDPFGRGATPASERPIAPPPERVLATPERTLDAAPSAPPATPPSDASSAVRTGSDLGIVLVDLQRELMRSSAFSDQPMREILAMALLAVIDPEIELTTDHLRDLTADEQEKVLLFNRIFSGLGQKLDANTNSVDALVECIEQLRTELVDLPELRIPDAALCWRVERFGTYDRFEPYRFLANEGQEVILYLELLGFTSVLGAEGTWVTELSQQIRIYDDRSGVLVWEDPWRSVTDTSTRERTDFFTTQQIFLPRRLSIGRYNLKIHVRDEQSGAEAERTLTFDIVAQRDLSATP